jgi:preprotein translocase subunit SecF
MEVNTMFITGLLTVIGFSVHDTIVVLDRIRENRQRYPDLPLHECVNNSILQTLGRSINTSFTVVLSVTALLLIGGVTIRPFLVVMLIGTITGTYSSIFVASQILVTWEDRDIPRLFRRIFPRRARTVVEEG